MYTEILTTIRILAAKLIYVGDFMSSYSPLSIVTVPIEIITSINEIDTIYARGTGVFYSGNNETVNLITNWHIVTARNPYKLAGNINIPYKLRLHLHNKSGDNNLNISNIEICDIIINNKDGNSPKWFEHPTLKYKVDIVCIEIAKSVLNSFTYNYLNDFTNTYFAVEVMDEVNVIGYPGSINGGNRALPIFKRGSIASEPNLDFDGLPCFLIDCKTTEGMSGSPVIASRFVIGNNSIQKSFQFVGVHSSSLTNADPVFSTVTTASEIAVVWKIHAIEDIVRNRSTGTCVKDLPIFY